MLEKLLPIGSIVRLKEGVKRVMIFGIRQTNPDTDEEFDYIGVLYPEGNMGQKFQFLFNHEDIDEVYFRGYEDEERTGFIKKLETILSTN